MASLAQLAGMIRTNMDDRTRSIFRRQLFYVQAGSILLVLFILLDFLKGC